MHFRKQHNTERTPRLKGFGFKDLLLRLLDKLSAFCTGFGQEPVPVRVQAKRSLLMIAVLFTTSWVGAGELGEKNLFPELQTRDLPIVAQGIQDHDIMLDQSLSNLPESGHVLSEQNLDRVKRSQNAARLIGEWL